jgi:hypothetical protein
VLNIANTKAYNMASKATVKVYESQSRHSINLPKEFVNDSSFPFEIKEELTARIEGDKIIIEKKRNDNR